MPFIWRVVLYSEHTLKKVPLLNWFGNMFRSLLYNAYIQYVMLFSVMLQPMTDLTTVEWFKHKHMVLSMYAPPDFIGDDLDTLVGNSLHTHTHTHTDTQTHTHTHTQTHRHTDTHTHTHTHTDTHKHTHMHTHTNIILCKFYCCYKHLASPGCLCTKQHYEPVLANLWSRALNGTHVYKSTYNIHTRMGYYYVLIYVVYA